MTEWDTEELVTADPPSVAAATYGAVLVRGEIIVDRGAHD